MLIKAKKYKIIAFTSAMILVVAICVTGTYTWQSNNQEALNEVTGDSNPGGRLHDDFDGSNKDVYVENFTNPKKDGIPVYARIRLYEYMEIGPDAGTNRQQNNRDVKPVFNGADIENVSTWNLYIPNDKSNTIHNNYWEWDMGGSTVYMPTFNKNKDSLSADINGTFAGPDKDPDTDGDRYADYKKYTVGQKETSYAVYDADNNNIDEGSAAKEGINIKTVEETHEAKLTKDGGVLTMAEWKSKGSQSGKYWVYDTDGWAYWAEPILPGEATGLLLDGIKQKMNLYDGWYYSIYVEAQFATKGDWGDVAQGTGFYKDNISPDALLLLNKISGIS